MNYSRSKSLIALLLIVAAAPGALAAEKPNIIWITVEDMSCHFGYQGQALVDTPNVDRLATQELQNNIKLMKQWKAEGK